MTRFPNEILFSTHSINLVTGKISQIKRVVQTLINYFIIQKKNKCRSDMIIIKEKIFSGRNFRGFPGWPFNPQK